MHVDSEFDVARISPQNSITWIIEQESKVKYNSASLFFLFLSLPSFLPTLEFYTLNKLQLYNTVLSTRVTKLKLVPFY